MSVYRTIGPLVILCIRYVQSLDTLSQGVDSLAQWLEHWIFVQGALGSNPLRDLKIFFQDMLPLLVTYYKRPLS